MGTFFTMYKNIMTESGFFSLRATVLKHATKIHLIVRYLVYFVQYSRKQLRCGRESEQSTTTRDPYYTVG
jgi:hypothetical protein